MDVGPLNCEQGKGQPQFREGKYTRGSVCTEEANVLAMRVKGLELPLRGVLQEASIVVGG